MPKYARVMVDRSGSVAFDYEIPAALEAKIQVGSRVSVPVRNRTALATVIELLDNSDVRRASAPSRKSSAASRR